MSELLDMSSAFAGVLILHASAAMRDAVETYSSSFGVFLLSRFQDARTSLVRASISSRVAALPRLALTLLPRDSHSLPESVFAVEIQHGRRPSLRSAPEVTCAVIGRR
jgi:hypothetical protein